MVEESAIQETGPVRFVRNPYSRQYYICWAQQLILNASVVGATIWIIYIATSSTFRLAVTTAVTVSLGSLIVGFLYAMNRTIFVDIYAQSWYNIKVLLLCLFFPHPSSVHTKAWDIYHLLPPLKDHEIRLVWVKQSYMGVQCTIGNINLVQRDNIKYTAISYTWGDELRDHFVYWGFRPIPVTRSCYEALQNVNRVGGFWNNACWIDQLSVNQSNHIEKGQQVQLMGEIFSKAAKVMVWLGYPHVNYSDTLKQHGIHKGWVNLPEVQKIQASLLKGRHPVHDTLKSPVQEMDDIIALKGMVLAATLAELPHTLNVHSHGELQQGALEEIAALFGDHSAWCGFVLILRQNKSGVGKRLYFQRRWIVQECIPHRSTQPQAIVCYFRRFSTCFDTFVHAVQGLNIIRIRGGKDITKYTPMQSLLVLKKSDTELNAIDAIGKHRELRLRTGSNADFDFLLSIFSHTECQDPRDVFYAIRSIANNSERVPKPHYDQSVDKVFRDHLQYFFDMGLGPSLIQRSGLVNGKQRLGLPSWCPAWVSEDPSSLPERYLIDINTYALRFCSMEQDLWLRTDAPSSLRAGGEKKAHIRYDINTGWLSLQGIVLGHIRAVQPNSPYTYRFMMPHPVTEQFALPHNISSDMVFLREHSTRFVLPNDLRQHLESKGTLSRNTYTGPKCFESTHKALAQLIMLLHLPRDRVNEVWLTMTGQEIHQLNELLPKRMLCALDDRLRFQRLQAPGGKHTAGEIQLSGVPIGLVPFNAVPGDAVVVFEGFASPMVLRECPAGTQPCSAEENDGLVPAEKLHRVVGEAYFVQYADGEALQNQRLLRKQFTLI